jgi:hypothetical protein
VTRYRDPAANRGASTLICFIYDPDREIANPKGLEDQPEPVRCSDGSDPCLDCGRLSRSGSRCPACIAARGGLSERGSTRRWRRLRAAVINQAGAQGARCATPATSTSTTNPTAA